MESLRLKGEAQILSQLCFNNGSCCYGPLIFYIVHVYSNPVKVVYFHPYFQALAIRDKYYPIETDPSMSIEEKTPYMVEW